MDSYSLSLHDALPILRGYGARAGPRDARAARRLLLERARGEADAQRVRSEEHTSELQSQFHLVCRLLLEKKKRSSISSSRIMRSPRAPTLRSSASPEM